MRRSDAAEPNTRSAHRRAAEGSRGSASTCTCEAVAPVHVLVITRDHHDNVAALTHVDPSLAAELLGVAAAIGASNASGFRVVLNTGADGGQSVNHVHAHVLAGRGFAWPPG